MTTQHLGTLQRSDVQIPTKTVRPPSHNLVTTKKITSQNKQWTRTIIHAKQEQKSTTENSHAQHSKQRRMSSQHTQQTIKLSIQNKGEWAPSIHNWQEQANRSPNIWKEYEIHKKRIKAGGTAPLYSGDDTFMYSQSLLLARQEDCRMLVDY